MDSVHATSDGEAAATTLFTSRLVRRATPVVRTSRRALNPGTPGQLAGRIGDFGERLGLSHTSRWALDAQRAIATGSAASATVRPPVNYWPWRDADEPAESVEPVAPEPVAAVAAPRRQRAMSPADRKLDDLRRMLGIGELTSTSDANGGGGAARVAAPAVGGAAQPVRRRTTKRRDQVVHRGLPRTLVRRGGTSRGAPGDIAQRMRPQAVDPRTIGTREAAAPPPPPPRAERSREPSDRPTQRDRDRPPNASAVNQREQRDNRAPGRPPTTSWPTAAQTTTAVTTTSGTTTSGTTTSGTTTSGTTAAGITTSGAGRPATAPGAVPRLAPVATGAALPAREPSDPIARRTPVATLPAAQIGASPSDLGRQAPRERAQVGAPDAPARALTPTPQAPAPLTPARPRTDVAQRAVSDGGAPAGPTRPTATQPATAVADAATPPAPSRAATPSPPATRQAVPREPAPSAPRDLSPRARQDSEPQIAADPTRSVRRDLVAGTLQDIDLPSRRGEQPRSPTRPTAEPTGAPTDIVDAPVADAAVVHDPDARATRTRPTVDVDLPARPPTFPAGGRVDDVNSPDTTATTATTATTWADAARPTMRRALAAEAPADQRASGSAADAAVRRGVQPRPPSPEPSSVAASSVAASLAGTANGTTNGAANGTTTTARRPESPAIRPPAAPAAASSATTDHVSFAGGAAAAVTSDRVAADTRSPTVMRRADTEASPETRQPAVPSPRPAIRRASDIGSSIPGSAESARRELPSTARPGGRLPVALIARRRADPSMAMTDAATDAAGTLPGVSERAPRSAPSPTAPSTADDRRQWNGSAAPQAPAASSAPSTAPAQTMSPSAKPVVRRSPAARKAPAHRQYIARQLDEQVRRSPALERRAEPSVDHRAAPPVVQRAEPSADPTAATQDGPRADRALPVPADVNVRALPTAPPLAAAALMSSQRDDWSDVAQGDTIDAGAVTTVHRRTAADIAGPGNDAAARFRTMLQRAPATSSALPSRWRPLATAIVGERPVRISTSAASRAALQAAGKVAATSGNVVHLARPLRGDVDAPLLAHELAHVANPSAAPRFFDDHRDSPEERRAELVADVIRRSPMLPRPAAASTAPGATIRRALRPAPTLASLATGRSNSTDTSTSASTSVSASALAAQISGSGSAHVQREFRGGSGSRPSVDRGPSITTSGRPPSVMRALTEESEGSSSSSLSTDVRGTWPVLSSQLDSSSLTDFVDWIMEQLEDRIGRELERRGGRYRGDF